MKRETTEAYQTNPYLYIWGVQWMADSLLQYFWMADPHGTIRKTTLVLAALLSIVWLIRGAAKRTPATSPQGAGIGGSALGTAALLAALLLVIAALLTRAEGVPPYFAELFRSVILALFYIGIGVRLGRELVYLGSLLLALVIVIWGWYLGYAPIVLGFAGGASLLVCAVIFRIWGKLGGRDA